MGTILMVVAQFTRAGGGPRCHDRSSVPLNQPGCLVLDVRLTGLSALDLQRPMTGRALTPELRDLPALGTPIPGSP